MAETLHFTVGADAGIQLINIAQEHLLYNNDIDKALNVFNESFGGGCPVDLQLELLRGDKVIVVDVEQQEFVVCDREPYHDKFYPARIDFEKWFAEKQYQLKTHCNSLEAGLDMIANKFRNSGSYEFRFSNEAVVNFVYGNDEDLIAELQMDYELNDMRSLITLCRDFIEKSFRFSKLVRELNAYYGLEIDFNTLNVTLLGVKLQKIARQDFWTPVKVSEADIALENYLDASREIAETIDKGIVPVDILDNYSAGWLSPEGEYYALNGEIANMLHIQIADALQDKGIIPLHEVETDGVEINPDSWLEQRGWVKIHGNEIQFAGCLNSKIDLPNINLTQKQIEVIRDYITDCHQCIIKAGWRRETTSIGLFTAMAMRDPIALYKKYFDYN